MRITTAFIFFICTHTLSNTQTLVDPNPIGHKYYSDVKIDLYNRVLLDNRYLPFDVPFYFTGELNQSIIGIEAKYWCVGCVDTFINTWSRAPEILKTKESGEKFYLLIDNPLKPDKQYQFDFSIQYNIDSIDRVHILGLAGQYLYDVNELKYLSIRVFNDFRTGRFINQIGAFLQSNTHPKTTQDSLLIDQLVRDTNFIRALNNDFQSLKGISNPSSIIATQLPNITSRFGIPSTSSVYSALDNYYSIYFQASDFQIYETLLRDLIFYNFSDNFPRFQQQTSDYFGFKYGNLQNSPIVSADLIWDYLFSPEFSVVSSSISAQIGVIQDRIASQGRFQQMSPRYYASYLKNVLGDTDFLDTLKKFDLEKYNRLNLILTRAVRLHDRAVQDSLNVNHVLFINYSFEDAIFNGLYEIGLEDFRKFPVSTINYSNDVLSDLDAQLKNLDSNLLFFNALLQLSYNHGVKKETIKKLEQIRQQFIIAAQLLNNLNDWNNSIAKELLKAFETEINRLTGLTSAESPQTTTADFLTRAEYYISGDLGLTLNCFSVGSNYSSAFAPYFGVNFNLNPINRQARYSIFDKKKPFFKSISLMMGITITDEFKDDKRENLLLGIDGNFLIGGALRISNFTRLSAGTVWYKYKNDNPAIKNQLVASPFISVSLDLDVKKFLKNFGKIIFPKAEIN